MLKRNLTILASLVLSLTMFTALLNADSQDYRHKLIIENHRDHAIRVVGHHESWSGANYWKDLGFLRPGERVEWRHLQPGHWIIRGFHPRSGAMLHEHGNIWLHDYEVIRIAF